MRSSISNSSQNTLERVVPTKNWLTLFFIALPISIIALIIWEFHWRSKGYIPTINDNKDAWAIIREKVEKDPSNTVLIGASRMLFDFNLAVWEKAHGKRPYQLATVGTNPFHYLEDLALNSKFNGTLLVGITPPLFFVPEGMPVDNPKGNIKHFKHFSYAQKWSHYLGLIFDKNLAFIEQEDLALKKLIDSILMNPRVGAQLPPKLPPFFMTMEEDRQGAMLDKVLSDEKLRTSIQQGWIPLFTPPPPPPIFTPEQFFKMFMDHVNNTILKTKDYIDIIHARGGKVVFIRFPSTEKVRELENQFAPRAGFWDRLVKETGVDQAIHFEDYEQLKNFQCPEWSHLSAEDSVKFTEELVKIINLK